MRSRDDLDGATGQAAGATAAFVAALGAYGYATRRDLSSWGRTLFWTLLGLIAFGIVAIFVSIPNSNIIYAVAGLGIFGAFTIYDFNRLRRSTPDAAVPIAAGIPSLMWSQRTRMESLPWVCWPASALSASGACVSS